MMKNKTQYKEIFLIISSFLVGGITMLAIVRFTPLVSEMMKYYDGYVITKGGTKVLERTSLSTSVNKVYDAVVVVQGYINDRLDTTGTGFVYKVDNQYGYILTNEHVITGSNKIKVIMTTDEETSAELLGKDEYLDLAVLRIDKSFIRQIAEIGKSEEMNLGDIVFTVGSPLGYDYRGSVTSGVLSGKDRLVSISVSGSNNNDWVMRVLQIDASINPGNSGGPLLNVNGEVIGVCSMKLVDDDIEGMGFAIPIEYAMSHVESLEHNEKIKWPILGIGMTNVADSTTLSKNNIKVPNNIKEGVVITNIKEGTGAAKSNLKKGDIITKINGRKVKDSAYLRYEIYQHQSGDVIELTYIRDEKEKIAKVTLSS